MSYGDFEAFQDFISLTTGSSCHDLELTLLWDEVVRVVPKGVLRVALWGDNRFARELLKQYIVNMARDPAPSRRAPKRGAT
jgi:hypothetical protein